MKKISTILMLSLSVAGTMWAQTSPQNAKTIENGKFYQFQCGDSNAKYIGKKGSGNVWEMNDKTNAGIFYVTTATQAAATAAETATDYNLLLYPDGQYFGKKDNNASGKNYGLLPIGQKQNYQIQLNADNWYISHLPSSASQRRYLHGGNAQSKLDAGNSASLPTNNAGYKWKVIEVTELPVTVSEAGWATLYAPVTLTIPTNGNNNVKVYTGKVNGNYLTLTQINDKIPAYTPVLIEANQGTYNFAIDYNPTAEAKAIDQSLSGTIETKAKEQTKTYFTLQKMDGQANAGFYKYTGENLQGFRAYGENLLGTTSAASGLVFDFGEATGIESIEMPENEKTVIYDLSGRRVAKAQKGIYIINGKKVVIK